MRKLEGFHCLLMLYFLPASYVLYNETKTVFTMKDYQIEHYVKRVTRPREEYVQVCW